MRSVITGRTSGGWSFYSLRLLLLLLLLSPLSVLLHKLLIAI